MVYVMGMDAAKSRPATEAERTEMRRLLARGNGRRARRVLNPAARPRSTQADFDGSPMVTD